MNPVIEKEQPKLDSAQPCIILADRSAKYVLPLQSILRLESKRVYTIVYVKHKDELVCCKNISTVHKWLDENFFRVHRSHVINLREISTIETGVNMKIVMSDGSVVPVSQRKKAAFLKAFYGSAGHKA